MLITKVLILAIQVVLGSVLFTLLALVLIPVWLKCSFGYDEGYEGTLDVRCLWGLLGVGFVMRQKKKFVSFKVFASRVFTHTIEPASPERRREKALKKRERKTRRKEKRRKKRPSPGGSLEEVLGTVQSLSLGVLREGTIFLQNLFSSLKLGLSGEAEMGLSDPADTGRVLGLYYAATGVLDRPRFRLSPNWEKPILRGNVFISTRVWMADIIVIAIKAVFASSIRRMWWNYLKRRFSF